MPICKVAGKTVAVIETALLATTFKFMCSILVWFSCIRNGKAVPLQAWSGPEGSRKLTLRLLMSYIYGAPSKARNANVVYIWTYVWQR